MPGEPTLMRVLITGRHWQKFKTFEAQFRRAADQLAAEHDEPDLRSMTVSLRQFERWYAGRVKTAPHPDACRVLEHMFGFPVHQLLGAASQAVVPAERVEPAQRDSSPHFPDSILNVPGTADKPSLIYPGRADDGEGISVIFGGSALTDPERIIAMAAQRAMRFSVSADASNVGPDSLDLLRSEVSRLAVAYPQQPLSAIIGDIVTLQDSAFTLLEGRQRPRESRDLYVIGGLASGMIAKAAHDYHDPYTAMTHARTALLCAKNAEHEALTAWVYGLQSLITYWADRPRDAIQYAQAGAQTPGITGSVRVWLASLEARAWSVLGNSPEGQRAIETASDLRERITTDDLDALGGICYFSRARQLYYAADAGASLPAPNEQRMQGDLYVKTEAYALEAITAYTEVASDEKSFGDEAGARTDLAIARIRTGNIDGALEAINPVLNLPVPQRIHGVIGSVVDVHKAITAASSDAVVAKTLQEEIENYCRTPAAALPS